MTAPVLQTARLALRPFDDADVGALTSILAQPGVARWWGAFDDADVRASFAAQKDFFAWTILSGDQIAGVIQVEEEPDPDYRHAHLDIFLAESFQGQGLGPEAIRAVTQYLITERGHHRMVIDPSVENASAIAAYERVGFRRVGVMRRYERRDGQFRDGLLLELVVKRPDQPGGPSILPGGGARLRRATSDDVPVVLPMMRDFNRSEGIAIDEAVLVPALAVLLADASLGVVWLIEGEDDAVVGYAVVTFGFDLEWGGRDAWLTELWVTTTARGEGLGRAALEAVEREARLHGANALHLMVRHENVRARGLYQSAGFESPRRETLTKRL